MPHVKIIRVHDRLLLSALRSHLVATQATPQVGPLANALIAAVQEYAQEDAAEIGKLPPDAHITAHAVESDGTVALVIESAAFPWTPDGLPFDQMKTWTPPAPETEA